MLPFNHICLYLLSSEVSTTSITQFDSKTDEHNIIANYCSKLSEFYTKNPKSIKLHSTSSSELSHFNSSTTPKQKQFHSKNFYINSNEKYDDTLNGHRSVSLHRNLSSIENKEKTKQTNTFKLPSYYLLKQENEINENNATRSLSETNFITGYYNKDIDYKKTHENERITDEKREIVSKLEQKNKEIIKEIKKLKLNNVSRKTTDQSYKIRKLDSQQAKCENLFQIQKTCLNNNSNARQLRDTLETLKQHKDLLENRMLILESSRDELINKLTHLDTYIKPHHESKSLISKN
jgi:hypothetical protein